MKKSKILFEGMISNNATFVMLLGLCSVLAQSNSLSNAFGMGVAVLLVLMATNVLISLVRKITPDEIRIPVYIVIIAAVVTIIQMLMQAFTPALASTLGVFLPLIVVNCIIMARAEVFAAKNGPLDSLIDAIGVGLGYVIAINGVAVIREIIGTGALKFVEPFGNTTLFDIRLFPVEYSIPLFTSPSGAFIMLGLVLAVINAITFAVKNAKAKKVAVATPVAAK